MTTGLKEFTKVVESEVTAIGYNADSIASPTASGRSLPDQNIIETVIEFLASLSENDLQFLIAKALMKRNSI